MITDWITALATCLIAFATTIYTIFFIITLIYVKKQFEEYKLYRNISVLQNIYDYVIKTKEERKKIFEEEEMIKGFINEGKALSDIYDEKIRDAIHNVANVYHYAGFLIKTNLLGEDFKNAFFEEGGETFFRIYTLIYPLIEEERKKPFKKSYKQYKT